jgi:hypothetical protein
VINVKLACFQFFSPMYALEDDIRLLHSGGEVKSTVAISPCLHSLISVLLNELIPGTTLSYFTSYVDAFV